MKIALIGATGFVGTSVLDELINRGHQVTVLARTPAKVRARSGVTVVKSDALHSDQVANAVEGHDAVVSAYNPGWSEPQIHDLFLEATHAIFTGVKQAGVKRFLMVGGAGSLFVAPGVQLVDTPSFPADIKLAAAAAREALNLIQKETSLDWTFLSPPIGLAAGVRTGQYRVGADNLLSGVGDAPAGISVQDMAVAIVDELEKPQHIKKRFTVAN